MFLLMSPHTLRVFSLRVESVLLKLDHRRLPGPLLASHGCNTDSTAAGNDRGDALGPRALERLEQVVHLLVPLGRLSALSEPAVLRLLSAALNLA